MKGFMSTMGNLRDALIYGDNDSGTIPVYGFFSGSSSSLSSFLDCASAPVTHQQIVQSTFDFGFVDRLEIDQNGCRKEEPPFPSKTLTLKEDGKGKLDKDMKMRPNIVIDWQATGIPIPATDIDDLSIVKVNAGVGDWEAKTEPLLEKCQMIDPQFGSSLTLTQPVFDYDDHVDYYFDSFGTPFNVPFTQEWDVSGATCSVSFSGFTYFVSEIDSTNTSSNNLNALVGPLSSPNYVSISTADTTLHNKVHTISVLATTPDSL